eukprot:4026244-Pleurochrysis_carterae.AAC.3
MDQEVLDFLRACRHRSCVAVPHSGCRAQAVSDAAPCWRRHHTCDSYGEGVRRAHALLNELG